MRSILPLIALLALAACRDEPTVAERFNSLKAEVENKGIQYEAEAENVVAAEERRLANEAESLFRQNLNVLGNAGEDVEVDLNAQ